MMATFLKQLWERLAESSDEEVAAIAGKAVKEARYHQQHAADWMARLGQGTEESRSRIVRAIGMLWPYSAELFDADDIDRRAQLLKLGPAWDELREAWDGEMRQIVEAAGLAPPQRTPFISTGKRGVHSEHMGFILAEMQYLQRAYPGGVW